MNQAQYELTKTYNQLSPAIQDICKGLYEIALKQAKKESSQLEISF